MTQFEEFWGLYPRRVGKGAARTAFAKALKLAHPDEIMSGLSQQLPYLESRPMEFRPHPATWLNQERWADEPQIVPQPPRKRTICDAANDFDASFDYRSHAVGLPSIERH